MKEHDPWASLVIEKAVAPLPVSDDTFRTWMTERGIFISSPMDDEMLPFRQKLRQALLSWGARTEMWEELSPRDTSAQRAYLDGVDRSSVFLLVLGRRYGASDATGYSPTHQEANRASERNLTRFLFTRGDVDPAGRDGRLNDWLRSLHAEVAGTTFRSDEELWTVAEKALRRLAAEDQQFWVKLDHYVFPGFVSQKRTRDGSEIIVRARVRTPRLRSELLKLANWGSGSRHRLTWSNYSLVVEISEVRSTSASAGDDEIEIVCSADSNASDAEWSFADMGYAGSTRQELIERWARSAFFNERASRSRDDMLVMLTRPDSRTLPEVLKEADASGWLAVGLCRLYLVEEVARRYAGQFDRLRIGPASARALTVDISFRSGAWSAEDYVSISGSVALPT